MLNIKRVLLKKSKKIYVSIITKNGAEICNSDREADFFGQWILEANDNQYIVNVRQYE